MNIRKIGVAATLALVCAPACPLFVEAADFANVKKTYVPPSMIDRRVDFSTLREHQATQFSQGVSSAAKKIGASLTAPRSSGAIVPPPPPYANQLAGAGKALQAQAKKLASSPHLQSALASLRSKATELARAGKFDEAKLMAAKALQLAPQDPTTLKNMANATLQRANQFVNNGEMDKALQYARQSLAYDGTNPSAKKTVEGLLLKAGINPNSAEERLKSADLLASQGRNDEAFAEYQAALKLKPSAEAHVGIGNMALRAGQKDRAKSEYQAAIELDSNSSVAYRQLGLLKYGNGDVVGANAGLSRALVLNPKDKQAAKSLVELWQHQVSRVPGANSHLGLARAYQLSGDLNSAQAQYRTVVRLDPENPHLPAARHAFKLALARQDAEKAVEAARTLEAHGAISDAFAKAHEAVKLSPGDADLRVYEGELLEKMQKFSGARDSYLNALRINPHHTAAAAHLKGLPPDVPLAPPIASAPPTQALTAADVVAANSLATNGTLTPGLPAVTHDPVANISNFATSLRDQMMTQKNQISNIESVAQKVISSIGAAPPVAASLATDTASGAATAIGAEGALASPIAETAGGGVASALANAAAAIAAAKGTTPLAAAAATTAAPVAAAAAPSTTAAATTAAPAAEDAISGLLKPNKRLSSAYQQMQSLKSQNSQLQAQLQKMRESLAKVKNTAPPEVAGVPSQPQAAPGAFEQMATTGSTQPMTAATLAAQSLPLASEFEPPVAPPIAATLAGQQVPVSQLPGMQSIAPMVDHSAAPVSPALRQPIALPNAIRLELEGASPHSGNVELSVLLRNDADVPLQLPGKMKAIINYSNRRPAEVKPMFADSFVPAHGAIRGIIRVPFDKVDPTADLVIPGLLPEGSTQRDVHLITSMASR